MASIERLDCTCGNGAVQELIRSFGVKVNLHQEDICNELASIRREIAGLSRDMLNGGEASTAASDAPARRKTNLTRMFSSRSQSSDKRIAWNPDEPSRAGGQQEGNDDSFIPLASSASTLFRAQGTAPTLGSQSSLSCGILYVHDGYVDVCDESLKQALQTFKARTTVVRHGMESFGEAHDQRITCILSPTSFIRVAFDVVSVVFLLYELAVTPYILAWDPPFNEVMLGTCAVTAFWTLDLLMSFQTGYFQHGTLVMEPRKVRRRYLRTYFGADLLLVVLDFLNLLVHIALDGLTGSSAIRLARLAKITRVLRLLKIVRISHLGERVNQLKDAITVFRATKVAVDILELLCLILVINHIIACLWYGLMGYARSDTGYSWLQAPIAPGAESSYMDSGFGYQYTTSLHWALTQMTPGSMQVGAHNTAERAFNIAILLFGMFVFSTIVSAVSSKVTQHRMRMQDQIATMSQFDRFVRQKRVSHDLSMNMRRQIQERLNESKPLGINDVQGLQLVSKSLRTQLYVELYRRDVLSLPIFLIFDKVETNFSSKLFSDDVVSLRLLSHAQQLFAVRENAVAAYHVFRGEIRYAHASSSAGIWEEVAAGTWMSEVALWCKWRHRGVAEAAKISEVLAVNASALLDLLPDFPMLFDLASAYANTFTLVWAQDQPDRPELDDTTSSSIPIEDIFVEMPSAHQIFVGLTSVRCMRQRHWFDALLGHTELEVLRENVLRGKCAVIHHSETELLRVVVDVEIKLENCEGCIFVSVPQPVAGTTAASCKLPGMKKEVTDTYEDVVHMIADTFFGPYAHYLEIGSFNTLVSYEQPDNRGLKTKHIKRIYKAVVVPEVIVELPTLDCGTYTVEMIAEGQEKFFHAWLRPAEFDYLCSPRGNADLEDLCCKIGEGLERERNSFRSLVSVTPTELVT
eukprot:TRINITY_DN32330_c0_g1_i1.p1 TRINITY_DN32330_c0_g1~~TRINITY_DN32330_c0_g1_i1.p1  ORF type:complete len:941 (+),score=66.85 TRINITY_DN32330_c0_g1_i1:68-2824(+)